MPETLTLYLSRAQIITANERKHWAQTAPVKQVLRALGFKAALSLPRYERVRLVVVVSYPDRVARDVANLQPTLKALVDGMVSGLDGKAPAEAGILPDDNDRYFVGPHMEWSGVLSDKPGRSGSFRFDLTFEALPPLPPA